MSLEKFKIIVNEKSFECSQSKIIGAELLNLIGLNHSTEYEILLKLSQKEFEPIELNESIDLTNPEIETFIVKPYPSVTFELDDEDYPFEQIFMTPIEIMAIADIDAAKFYLKQIIGAQEISYKNDENHLICMHNKIKFCTCKKSNTTVS